MSETDVELAEIEKEPENFSERVQFMREQLKLRQWEVAKKLGVNTGTYHHYENGYSKPTLDILIPLAEIFQVTPAWLAFGEIEHTLPEILPEDRYFLDRYNLLDARGKRLVENVIGSETIMRKRYKTAVRNDET